MTEVAFVAEQCLVARRAVGVSVFDHVATTDQLLVTLETGEVSLMPLTVHCPRRLARKYQLYKPFQRHPVYRSAVFSTLLPASILLIFSTQNKKCSIPF